MTVRSKMFDVRYLLTAYISGSVRLKPSCSYVQRSTTPKWPFWEYSLEKHVPLFLQYQQAPQHNFFLLFKIVGIELETSRPRYNKKTPNSKSGDYNPNSLFCPMSIVHLIFAPPQVASLLSGWLCCFKTEADGFSKSQGSPCQTRRSCWIRAVEQRDNEGP